MSSPSSVDGAVSPSLDEHEDMDAEGANLLLFLSLFLHLFSLSLTQSPSSSDRISNVQSIVNSINTKRWKTCVVELLYRLSRSLWLIYSLPFLSAGSLTFSSLFFQSTWTLLLLTCTIHQRYEYAHYSFVFLLSFVTMTTIHSSPCQEGEIDDQSTTKPKRNRKVSNNYPFITSIIDF